MKTSFLICLLVLAAYLGARRVDRTLSLMTTGMTIDEKIAVLQAAKEGRPIQAKLTPAGKAIEDLVRSVPDRWTDLDDAGATTPYSADWSEWNDCRPLPHFNFVSYGYRIKPEPREFWFNDSFVAYGNERAATLYSTSPSHKPIHAREVTN